MICMSATLLQRASFRLAALELVPIAAFKRRWNWGYDGALLFAPDSAYGRPEGLCWRRSRAKLDGLSGRRLHLLRFAEELPFRVRRL